MERFFFSSPFSKTNTYLKTKARLSILAKTMYTKTNKKTKARLGGPAEVKRHDLAAPPARGEAEIKPTRMADHRYGSLLEGR